MYGRCLMSDAMSQAFSNGRVLENLNVMERNSSFGAGRLFKLLAVDANKTLSSSDFFFGGYLMVTGDATGGGFTVTLPPVADTYDATSGVSTIIEVKRINGGANAVTIDGNSSETIDGELSVDIVFQYDSVQMIAGPTEWHII